MAGRKIVGILMGSPKDREHAAKVAEALRGRGWVRSPYSHIYVPHEAEDKTYVVNAGSVHRDVDGTISYAKRLSEIADGAGDRLIFLTCVGRRDEASGVISSYTGKRVVAVPPAAIEYGKYPDGVMVYPFSKEADRTIDITAAADWLNGEFDSPDWDATNAARKAEREKARQDLLNFRADLQDGKIEL